MKRIVLLSDGTGNSSAKLFKTNVWRLYQALDLAGDGEVQVACYNDGVGTSSFKPLALLGGAFGWGLKRNVLHLYEYLCRSWEPGDEIHVFGFSRGAFTVRVLVGLIVSQGLIRHGTDEELSYAAADAYRAYRARFNQTGGLVRWLRSLRDGAIALRRRLTGQTRYAEIPYVTWFGPWRDQDLPPPGLRRDEVPEIAFVGVWDTVAAYGTPVAELTRGIDDWVWPLSMPDYCLSPKVRAARQALALDDERDTFHPVLWDEVAEDEMIAARKVPPGRLKQVWFAGMHADVGGGYPDDSLSRAPLGWMMGEAAGMGLAFDPAALRQVAPPVNSSAPLHDSRRGLGGYYRYQPRKIAARIHDPQQGLPDRTALIMQDPDDSPGARAQLTSVRVHVSVLERIRSGPDAYAPIVLPAEYAVEGWDGTTVPGWESPAEARQRASMQNGEVWNDVWRRRVNYFATVGVSLLLALFPVLDNLVPAAACEGPQCLLSPVLQAVGGFLPGFALYWVEAFARHPGSFALLVVLLTLLLLRGVTLERRTQDHMRGLWQHVHGKPDAIPRAGRGDAWIEWLRTKPFYQETLQALKWRALPTVFGMSFLSLLLVLGLTVVVFPVHRFQVIRAEADGTICRAADGPTDQAALAAADRFDTRSLCWSSRQEVREGGVYALRLTVVEPWLDRGIVTEPSGFEPSRMPWPLGYLALPLRRSLNARWFQTFLTIEPDAGPRQTEALDLRFTGTAYVAVFTARASGRVHLWVNDAVLPFLGLTDHFYANNRGTAEVVISQLH